MREPIQKDCAICGPRERPCYDALAVRTRLIKDDTTTVTYEYDVPDKLTKGEEGEKL